MILDRAGLLDGRPAVTHGGALSDLREGRRTSWTRASSTTATCFTCGVTAGIDLALWLVEREWGADVAAAVATELEYERSQDVYRTGPRTVAGASELSVQTRSDHAQQVLAADLLSASSGTRLTSWPRKRSWERWSALAGPATGGRRTRNRRGSGRRRRPRRRRR